MTARVTLIGISAMFSPDEIECLVRTAGEAMCAVPADLTARQLELAQRAHDAIHDEEDRVDSQRSVHTKRLLALAHELNVNPLGLDDLVHDLVSNSASEINNGGLVAQIAYLLEEVGEAEAERAIRNAMNYARR